MSRPPPRSHGSGRWSPEQFASLGQDSVIEEGVMVFHPDHITIGTRVYIGHRTMLKAYHRNTMVIGDDCWIGQDCFFHSAGGIVIGQRVGIGPGVRIITSRHQEAGIATPILWSPLELSPVEIGDDSDVGVGAIILPGVKLGRGCQVGAGAVVTHSFPDFSVIAGVPARLLRLRSGDVPGTA
jgi:acetyltransferase-like isoleucine patch superfamily enzyme